MNERRPAPRCPHCSTTVLYSERLLQTPFHVRNLEYVVCDVCAHHYMSIGGPCFDIHRIKHPMYPSWFIEVRTNSLLSSTLKFEQFIANYQNKSLRNMLEENIIQMMYHTVVDEEPECVPTEQATELGTGRSEFFHNLGGQLSHLKESIEGKVEQIKQQIVDVVNRPEVKLHYDINKHRVQKKIQELKQSSMRLVDSCRDRISTIKEKQEALVGSIRNLAEELPSWSELKRELPSISSVKESIFRRLFK